MRILVGGAALLCTALVFLNVLQFIRSPADYRLYLFNIVPDSVAAVLGWWFAFRGHRPDTRAVLAPGFMGGMVLGGAGFLAGFIGPMVLAPHANQGPLLGIIVTGPAGFAIGALSGLAVAFIRQRLRDRTETH